jgi:hypothetical protein
MEDLYDSDFIIESIDYTDRRNGDADDLEIVLSTKQGKWYNSLLPMEGDNVKVEFIQGDNKLLTPEFFVDGIEWDKTNNSCKLSSLSYLYKKHSTIRKRQNNYYENTTIRNIIQSIAQRNNYKLLWFGSDVNVTEVYQKKQSDYNFLKQLAKENGAFFKFINKNLIWGIATDNYTFEQKGDEIIAQKSSGEKYIELNSSLFSSLNFSLQANKKTSTTWETIDIFDKKVNKIMGKKSSDFELGEVSADQINVKTSIQNKGKGSVVEDFLKGNLKFSGTIPVSNLKEINAVEIQSGSIVFLTDMYKLNGTYVIEVATHTMTASQGWTINIDAVRLTSKDLVKPSATKKYNRIIEKKNKLKELQLNKASKILKQTGDMFVPKLTQATRNVVNKDKVKIK